MADDKKRLTSDARQEAIEALQELQALVAIVKDSGRDDPENRARVDQMLLLQQRLADIVNLNVESSDNSDRSLVDGLEQDASLAEQNAPAMPHSDPLAYAEGQTQTVLLAARREEILNSTPGDRARSILRLLCRKKDREEVFEPLLEDMEYDYRMARLAGKEGAARFIVARDHAILCWTIFMHIWSAIVAPVRAMFTGG